jgi:uncharacterized oxidoreductase
MAGPNSGSGMKLSQRVILVTGGATGIGLELARQLKARENDVLICGRRSDAIAAAQRKIPGLRGLTCDLGREEGLSRLMEYLRDHDLQLDVLVNNAAVQVQVELKDQGVERLDALEEELRINLLVPFKITTLLLPALLRRPEAAIINMSSLLALMPKPNAPGYCASKAGLYAFSKSLQVHLKDTRVKVFVAFPPLVDTPMTAGRGSNKMSAEVFVNEMLRQIGANRREIRVGQARRLMALNRLAPGLADWLTRRISRGQTQVGAGH